MHSKVFSRCSCETNVFPGLVQYKAFSASHMKQRGPSIKRRKISLEHDITALKRTLLALLVDVEDLLGLNLNPEKGVVRRRTGTEGMGFLAIRLPEYFAWILRSLAQKSLQTPDFRMKLSRKSKGAARPLFLEKLVCILFDDSGKFIEPETAAQKQYQAEVLKSLNIILTSFGKKYELPLSPEVHDRQILDAFAFDSTQCLDVAEHWDHLSVEAQMVLRRARLLLVELFEDYKKPMVVDGEHKLVHKSFWSLPYRPKFGPGAVYEGYNAYEKYRLYKCPPLKAVRPLSLYQVFTPAPGVSDADCIINTADFSAREKQSFIASLQGGVCRSALVPKSYENGRLIFLMTNEMMYEQQAWKTNFYEWVGEHPLTAGYVNFVDQQINRELARQASADGEKATLDLKEASNTVSKGTVGILFDERVAELLLLLRPHMLESQLKDKTPVSSDDIRMYAPMGSALCFPIEALVFWAVAKAALGVSKCKNQDVYVYGDDIILTSEGSDIVRSVFSEIGFIVNTKKSFVSGPFRESCGMDALNGVSVCVPFRIKKRVPAKSSGLQPQKRLASVLAWVEYANLAELSGFPSLGAEIRSILREHYKASHSFPVTHDKADLQSAPLVFLDYSSKATLRSRFQKVIDRQKATPAPKMFWVGKPSSVYEQTLVGPYQPDTEPKEYRDLALAGTYKTFKEPAEYHGVRTRRFYGQVNKSYAPEISEPLAYMRWVLEKPEDSRVFSSKDAFGIERTSALLT